MPQAGSAPAPPPAHPSSELAPAEKENAAPELSPSLQLDGPDLAGATVRVCFSPGGEITRALTEEIAAAKTSIQIQTFQCTSPTLVRGLFDAYRRGVKVTLLLDESNIRAYEAGARYLIPPLLTVLGDARPAAIGGNVILIDGQTLITGAYRLGLPSDEGTASNLFIIKGTPKLAAAFAADFERHARESRPYPEPPAPPAAPGAAATPAPPTEAPALTLQEQDRLVAEHLARLERLAQQADVAGFVPTRSGTTIPWPVLSVSSDAFARFLGKEIGVMWTVTREGVPTEVSVLHSSGSKALDARALALIQRMRFPVQTDPDGRRIDYGMVHFFVVKGDS